MKTVHVVFKTHLDLGFTDYAQNVLDNYNNNYIPKALDLAYSLNEQGQEPKFIWTTGSYLIWQHLKYQSKEKVDRLVDAINRGYISWHGMPVTFQSEAAGKTVFADSVQMSRELDNMFNKKTVSAKMTDVPGHTKAIIPVLQKHGIKFLHIGMNGVSSIPDVPDNFIWKHGDSEIIVSYSKGYGDVVQIDGCEDILVFAHTHDNSGPPSKERVINQLSHLKHKYYGYNVVASTIDNYVNKLFKSELDLPIVTEEIGDTWIHGIASDPHKMRQYNILINLLDQWLDNKTVTKNDNFYYNYIYELMLIPEHTWGMDIKRHFSDYKNYTKDAFIKARKVDVINDDALTFRYHDIATETIPEMKYTNYTWDQRTYSKFEDSWKEQRQYIENALNLLPNNLKSEALECLQIADVSIPRHKVIPDYKVMPYSLIQINSYTLCINEYGAICKLVKDDISYASQNNQLFKLNYSVIGHDSYEVLRKTYLRELDKNFWAVDFFKPGIELQNEIILTETFEMIVDNIYVRANKIYVQLIGNDLAATKYGCPRNATIVYTITDKIEIDIKLQNKDASRYPEIISLHVNPLVNNNSRFTVSKLKEDINVLDVVGNGAKLMHCIDDSIKYEATDRAFTIKAVDCRVLSIGKINNIEYDKYKTNIDNGFYFHLLNTTWGTNFTMWYDQDINAKYIFEIT